MLDLTTLGMLRLDRDGVPLTGAAAQRRRLALLAIVAASARGVTRESLATLLWSDDDESHARHSLEQALYSLKSALGADPLCRTNTALSLDPGVIRADVAAFDAAILAGEWEQAARLYAGPFLAGVWLPDADDFERWCQRERTRRQEAYCIAMERCATAAVERQAHSDAVWWWQRLCEEQPLSGRAAAALVRTLLAAGEREAAARSADTHVERLRSEGLTPDPVIADLHAELHGHALHAVTAEPPRGDAREQLSRELHDALGGDYRIEGSIRRSSLYEVFKVRDVRTGKTLTLRVLEPALVRFGDRARMLRELKRLESLAHPNLVAVRHVGETASLIYLLGDDDEGETLRQSLQRQGELAIPQTLRLAREVGAALEHAHASDVLHLDLTPRRILMSRDGARVRDLGLVAVLRGALTRSADATGLTLGTVAYVSPEIALLQGTPDARSDVFSFAAVIFEALTGAPPFGVAGLAPQIKSAIPHARGIRDAVPEALDAALVQALAPVRGDRPPTVRAFLHLFAELSAG